jgi:predicted metal-dependent hydrolase
MPVETLEVNGMKYPVRIYYEKRNNSSVSIRKNGINIRIPTFLNREERFRQLFKMKQWARNKLAENPDRFKPEIQKEYRDREVFKIGRGKLPNHSRAVGHSTGGR